MVTFPVFHEIATFGRNVARLIILFLDSIILAGASLILALGSIMYYILLGTAPPCHPVYTHACTATLLMLSAAVCGHARTGLEWPMRLEADPFCDPNY